MRPNDEMILWGPGWVSLSYSCHPVALAVTTNQVCRSDRALDVWPPPHNHHRSVSADQCERGIWDGQDTRGSITLTLCAVCNLNSEAVISDRPAAVTCCTLPEWQMRLPQLDWCVPRKVPLITPGQHALFYLSGCIRCLKVCWNHLLIIPCKS